MSTDSTHRIAMNINNQQARATAGRSQTRALHVNAEQLYHLRAAVAAAYNLAVYQAGNNAESLRTPLTDDERARYRRLLLLNSERRDMLAEVLTSIDNM